MSSHNDSEELISVGRFIEPFQAQMAKGMLDAAGIESFLADEEANNLIPFAFRARLQVRREDEEAARRLLNEAEIGPEVNDE